MTELDRTKVTFEQAEGLEPLPTQLKPRELTKGLRAGLWHILYHHLSGAMQYHEYSKATLRDPWQSLLFDVHMRKNHLPADEFSAVADTHVVALKKIVLQGSYAEVLGLLQWLLRLRECPHQFSGDIAVVLEYYKAGYRLVDGNTFFPITSEEDAKVAERAFAALNSSDAYAGARRHLMTAAERLTAGDWSGSVRESIHAVESVVRVLTGKKEDFGKAIAVLEQRWSLHGALKASFGNLYGYTSDEPGIRHALLDPKAAVDEVDALFMFGACASFVTYLIGKERQSKTSQQQRGRK